MASPKQVEANRLNAQSSSGPKSAEGKAVSRLNALTHGLSGCAPEPPGFVSKAREEYERGLDAYSKEYRPNTFEQKQLVATMAIEAARVDKCREAGFALEVKMTHRAKKFWHQDRLREAEVIFAKLHKDPARWLYEIEATSQGCLVMIHRWTLLQSCLVKNRIWTDDQRTTALDLCGIPLNSRDGENEVDPDTDDLLTARLELCESELVRLNTLHDDYLPQEARDRLCDEQGVYLILSKQGSLLVASYAAAAHRRYNRAHKRLLDLGCKSHPVEPKQATELTSPPIPAAAAAAPGHLVLLGSARR